MAAGPHDKINNLQVVRAAAALFVVYFHSSYVGVGRQPFGSFGVDLFFVLSGFIMAGICARNPHAFFLRRLVRIVPPYWLFTLCVFAVAVLFPALVKATEADPVQLLKSLFFVPFRKSNGLIQPTLFLGWTLNYEMFFYAAVAAGLSLRRRHATVAAAALILLCGAVCWPFRGLSVLATFYSNPVMVEFILGIGCYQVYRCAHVPRGMAAILGLLIVGAFVTMAWRQAQGLRVDWLAEGDRAWFGLPACVVIVSAALLSKSGLDARTGWLVLVGDASYVLYLVHPYCELGLGKLLGRRLPGFAPDASLAGAMVALGVSTGVAVAFHLGAERPMLAALTRWLVPANRDGTRPMPLQGEVAKA